MSRRAVGILLRSRLAPSNLAPSFSRQRETPPPPPPAHDVPHRASSRQPLHTTNRSYAGPSEPEEKIDETELARLLEQFEPPETPPARGKADEPTTRGGKQKSKIEDYDAWHGWDGESDRPAPPPGSSGAQRSAGDSGAVVEGKTSEVDRYIRDVLSGVAESKAARERAGEMAKAARERAGEEVKAGERQVEEAAAAGTSSGGHGVKRDELEHVKPEGSHRAESTLPDSFEANVSPAGPSASATVRKQSFSKNDMSLLAKKLQSRLDDEIQRLKIQKESVKQSLALRAKEFGKDAQVQFGLLGGKVNEVTGYNEIERLKQDVRERGEYVVFGWMFAPHSVAKDSLQKMISHG